MRRRLGAAGALAGFGLSAAMVLLPATAALAHAERHVGPYTVAIGFGTEPAYVGYRGAFIPTSPGDYTFHITGAIGSTSVDESVTSSPTTFASVADPQTIQFPTKVPSSTELATKLDRQTARIQAEAAALTSANDAASSAKTFGIVGIVLGLTGIVVGGVALARARRRGPA
jgi:hypothetical protein